MLLNIRIVVNFGEVKDAGVSNLLASLHHTGRKRVVLGHRLNTQTLTKTEKQKKKKKVLSKFMILCWAESIAILGCMWPSGCSLDTPSRG